MGLPVQASPSALSRPPAGWARRSSPDRSSLAVSAPSPDPNNSVLPRKVCKVLTQSLIRAQAGLVWSTPLQSSMSMASCNHLTITISHSEHIERWRVQLWPSLLSKGNTHKTRSMCSIGLPSKRPGGSASGAAVRPGSPRECMGYNAQRFFCQDQYVDNPSALGPATKGGRFRCSCTACAVGRQVE